MKKNFTLAAICCALAAMNVQAAVDEPTTDVEGTEKSYTKISTFWAYGTIMGEQIDEDVEVVFGDEGMVYFKNFLNNYDTYIEGKMDGDKILMDLPQVEYSDEWYGDQVLSLLVEVAPPAIYADFSEVWYGLPADDSDEPKTIVFNITEDGTIVWDNPDGKYALGAVPVPDYMDMGAIMAFTALKFVPEGVDVSKVEMAGNGVVESMKYYDMNGRQISQPSASGIYIRVSTLGNGVKKAEKILVK